jgi:hypothetical protein
MDRCSFGLDGSAELVRLLIEWKIPFVLLGNYTFRTQIHVARDNGTRKGFILQQITLENWVHSAMRNVHLHEFLRFHFGQFVINLEEDLLFLEQ